MGRFGYTNELKRINREHEAARRSEKADAVVAWVALIGLAALMVWQMMEKAA